MDLEALFAAIEDEASVAYGQDDDLSSDRASAIDRYLGKNVIPAPDGRSQVVDRTVYETIQWIQPSLARIFANGDDVVDVIPVGPEDEAGAKQEGQYLNYVIMQRNNWPQVFDTASKSALMSKAGYLYAYKKVRRQIEVEKYERQTPEALALILKGDPEIISSREYSDDTAEPMIDPATQMQLAPPMLYDIELRRVKEEPQFCIEVLPPERCRISKRCKTVQLTEAPFFEYYDYPTISELRQDGIEVPDDVGSDEDPQDMPEDAARNQYGESSTFDEESQKRVYTRWGWIRHDTDGDGIAELQYYIVVGKKVVHREEVNRIPVAVLCPDPLPFRHVGMCPADVCSDIQDIKTVIMRGALDNLQLTNNTRLFLDPEFVNLDDALVSRPGGVIRGRNGAVYGQHIAPIAVPPVFPQAMEAYGFMEQVNEGRTGVNRYFQGTDQNALNKTASGVQQLSSMAAQRVEHVARMYAPGIVELFSVLHELILKAGKFEDRIKLNGQWINIDPTTWRKRSDFRITVGFAAGNKDAMQSRLMLIAQMQAEAAKGGLPIVQPRNMYETAIEMTKSADLSNPERFWTDPNTVPPQPPQPDPEIEKEKLKAQTTLQGKEMDIQSAERIEANKSQTERYKANLQAETQIVLAQHQAEVGAVMQDSQYSQQLRLEHGKNTQQARMVKLGKQIEEEEEMENAELRELFSALQQQMQSQSQTQQEMAQLLMQLGRAVTAPRVLERDKSGRPIGSRVAV